MDVTVAVWEDISPENGLINLEYHMVNEALTVNQFLSVILPKLLFISILGKVEDRSTWRRSYFRSNKIHTTAIQDIFGTSLVHILPGK